MNQETYNGILIVVALVSIFSPIITTLINNHYKVKIMKLESKNDRIKRANDLVVRVYEDYLRSAGAVITYADIETMQEYGKNFGLVMIHVPFDVFEDIQNFNVLISESEWSKAREKFKDITYRLRSIIDKMYK